MSIEFDPKRNSPQGADLDADLAFEAAATAVESTLDIQKRDRFELLSAYLDCETTPAERRLVETWLLEDPVMQRLYRRLQHLRQGIYDLPVPPCAQSPEDLAAQVLSRVDSRPRLALVGGGLVVAAVAIAGLTGLLTGNRLVPQTADSSSPTLPVGVSDHYAQPTARSDALMIALDSPIVEIPQSPKALPEHGYFVTPDDRNLN